MRILTLNYEFPPLGGGGGVATEKIARGFVELGHTVDIVTSSGPGLAGSERIGGASVHRVPALRRSKETASLLSLFTYPVSGFQRASSLCRTHEYDVIHTHFAVPTGPLGVVLSRIFGIDHLLSIHGGDIYDPTKATSPHRRASLRAVVRWVFSHSDAIVAQSSDTRSRAVEHYDIDPSAIDIIPLPYEVRRFPTSTRDQLEMLEERTYLVSIGRLVDRKGYRYFLEALSQLRADGYDVGGVIIGDGPERGSLERYAEELGIAERTTFAGNVTEDRKFQYLQLSDVYVLSSLHEGFGIVLQEAMQARLPIVATNNGGQTDLIDDGINGRLVRPGDSEALADAIAEICDSEKRSRRYGNENARQITEYEPQRICERYLNLYDDL